MKLKKQWLLVALVTVLGSLCLSVPVFAQSNEAVVSPALSVLAWQNGMAKSAVGDEMDFNAADFERALNASKISSITVTKLPQSTDGVLRLGESEVREGQTISAANLSFLTFSFLGNEIKNSAFCFYTDLGRYEIRCGLFSLPYENNRPIVSSDGDAAVSVGTYRDVSYFGWLDAYDPDGDALVYEIIEYPQNGSLQLTKTTGQFQYVPEEGFVGEDGFRYVVADRYGNYSGSAQVSMTVSDRNREFLYTDMEDSEAHVAAIALTEKGIMTSSENDGTYYFYPSEQVTRAEFVSMAMRTVGIEDLATAQTFFADDEEIPKEYRGYVATAQKLGYICGKIDADGELVFAPNEPITRAEAANVIYKMISPEIPVFKPFLLDMAEVPSWAEDAVVAAVSSGILTCENGCVLAEDSVDREDCATMLYRLWELK